MMLCAALLVAAVPAIFGASIPFTSSVQHLLSDNHDYVTIQLPRMSNEALQFAAEASRRVAGPYQFGHAVAMEVAMLQEATLSNAKARDADYEVYRLAFESENAFTMNLIFDQFHLPEGAEMFVVGEKETLGPFTSADHQQDGGFGTWPMDGSRLRLEIWSPVSAESKPLVRVKSVVHGFRSTKSAGRCNIDVRCPATKGWEDPIRSVVVFLTADGQGFCSGSMLNNAKNDGRQLFLTANHCVSGSTSDNMLLFNYERPACNSRLDGPHSDTVRGLKLLARNFNSDFALFEVVQEIPERYHAYLSGFNATTLLSSTATGIHHPSVDNKKYSFFKGPLTTDCWAVACRGRDPTHWKISSWTLGTTEPGSSGSALFNDRKQVIGQLTGGSASCYNPGGYDMYGAMYANWEGGNSATSSIKYYLDPEQTGVLAVDGVDLNAARRSQSASLVLQTVEAYLK